MTSLQKLEKPAITEQSTENDSVTGQGGGELIAISPCSESQIRSEPSEQQAIIQQIERRGSRYQYHSEQQAINQQSEQVSSQQDPKTDLMPMNPSSWFRSLSRRSRRKPLEQTADDTKVMKVRGETHLSLCSLPDDRPPQSQPDLYYTIGTRGLASRHKLSSEEKKMWHGIKQFNLDPTKGMKVLQENGIVGRNPGQIAKFLFEQNRLSKKQIGAYLGAKESLQQAVLEEFVSCHHFTDLLLVQALRQFLWSFRLPGEAQQIDRVMSSFASHYCGQNPALFSSPDTAYILSFAIIMLNTGLHNKNVRHKITEEQFVKQNQGIDSGSDLPVSMLQAIFHSIKEEPFTIPNETYSDMNYTFFSPDLEGWLEKQGGTWKSWKRRWFVLSDCCLYYFEHTAENSPKGIVPLENVGVKEVTGDSHRPWQMEIFSTNSKTANVKGCKTDKAGAVVEGNHKVYRLAASSREELDQWVISLREAARVSPLLEVVERKKEFSRRGVKKM